MEVAENKKKVLEFVEIVKNQRKVERLTDYFAADYVEHNAVVRSFGETSIQAYQNFLRHFFSGYPDTSVEVQHLVAEGDKVMFRAMEGGTNKGEFLKVPPTGKTAKYTEYHVFRFSNGKVVEHWVDPDLFSWLQQIGVIPQMG